MYDYFAYIGGFFYLVCYMPQIYEIWHKKTNKPIYNAIVWQCRRTEKFCKRINKKYQKTVFNKTGLYIDSYFSATKIKWIIDNCKNTKKLIKEDKILCGTIDTWIVWNLTNRKHHITDFTNASRTMLFNINKKIWDNNLLEIFNIPKSILPEVKNSSDDFVDSAKQYFFWFLKSDCVLQIDEVTVFYKLMK